jgi:hypothetical protein
MKPCVGLLGKQCPCGMWHGEGFTRIERGWQMDHAEVTRIKSSTPRYPQQDDADQARSVFASPAFWITGAVCLAVWAAVGAAVFSRF